MIKTSSLLGLSAAAIMASTSAMASCYQPTCALAEASIKVWAQNAAVVGAIKAQNANHANLTPADIDKLDKQWRAEKKAGGPSELIDGKMSNALAGYLKEVKAQSNGLITEIFVMDDKGLNVGQTNPTGDYMQGDEGKWKNTFGKGPGAVDISDPEDDGGVLVSQVSVAITDPATLTVVGAVTVGVDVNKLP